jgi:hypothetical protein
MDDETVNALFTEVEFGIPEAMHYMRRPVAHLVNREPVSVLVRYPPLERVWSDNGAMCEVFVRYPELVVTTVANGSPILGYLNEPRTWCGFIDRSAGDMLPAAASPGGFPSTLRIEGKDVKVTVARGSTALIVAPSVGGRIAERIVVAVTGAADAVSTAELALAQPDRQLVASMFMGGPYPRFVANVGV